jgi:molybdate transport system ATP-binding protein
MKLTLRNVRIRFGEFSLEIDLDLQAQSTAVYGPSGAGKSTLLEIVAGLRKPDSAFIQLNETILTETEKRWSLPVEKRRIAYVPQDLALFPHKSVRQNLIYGYKSNSSLPEFTREHVTGVLEIGGLLERYPNSLSGGEKQRVAFARALLSNPQLLLLDEPLASLDANLRDRVVKYLQMVRQEFRLPIIYVTHNPDEVVALCDEVFFLREGRCIKKGMIKDHFIPDTKLRYVSKEESPSG